MEEATSNSSESQGCIFGLGAPMLDIIATVDADYLKKYDLRPDDVIRAESKHLSIFDEISQMDNVEYHPGGATVNALKLAAWILGGENPTSFAGCIARDHYGSLSQENCRKYGVFPLLQYTTSNESTARCAALLTGTSRSLVTIIGAANDFTEDHFDNEDVWKWIERSKICYVTGFFLTVSPPSIMRVAKHTQKAGTVFSLNISAPFLCANHFAPMMEVMSYVDLLFGNESEAVAIAASLNLKTSDVAHIALKVSQLPLVKGKKSRIVVITQGPHPVIVAKDGKVTEYAVEPLSSDLIVDTTGAGDAFVGGFLAQFVKGNSISECVRCGIYASRVVIQRFGCTFPEKPDL